jgi:hypothetical protein
MKPDKVPNNMVDTSTKPRMGRPLKFPPEDRVITRLIIPSDLRRAAEIIQVEQKLGNFQDAIREMLREAAEARGLVDVRGA